MKKIAFMCFILLLFLAPGFVSAMSPLTVPQLTDKIADVEKESISLTGTIAGACMSGCKIWLTEGEYKKGDPVILVWAKDDAFKFRTDAAGQKVRLQGFAVGQYVDLCATEKKEKEGVQEGESCAKPETLNSGKEKQLGSITFFATTVEYL
ncbi:MAG: hypothetical protein V2I50_07160 [Desulfuromusa sp.]|jgi:hypothetical protein|nr:hypothetical protein [Desulfuromusa sp.]